MKYEQFDEFIILMSEANASEDYWYDVGVDEAMYLLERFSDEDWEWLQKNITNKSVLWQKRVVYCFEEENDVREINIILSLVETEDKELFEICIDTLRVLISGNNNDYILNNKELMERINELACRNSATGRIGKELLKKLQQG